MLTFKTEKLTSRVTRIYGFNTEMMYLVEGDERAALLDTGSGFYSLRACVEQLTTKPVIVLLTHGHVDHAMGADEFETVYMNAADKLVFASHGVEAFRKACLPMSPYFDQITEDAYLPTPDCNTFHDLEAGDVFDLGGVHIELLALAGHTRGSLAMLIQEERMLLLGDG